MRRKNDTPADPRSLVMLVIPGTPIFELAVPCEVFGIDRTDLVADWYRFTVCPTSPGAVVAGGFAATQPADLSCLEQAGTILVPGCRSVHDGAPPELLAALRAAAQRGARIASICSGTFVLAEAGLLDGRRATTHWLHADELATAYPAVEVDPSVLYTREGNLWTSAGTAAAIDLCLELVRVDHGSAVAAEIARRMVTPPHRSGGQAQYIRRLPVPLAASGAAGNDVASWARTQPLPEIGVAELAARAGYSHRTLIRRFKDTTGLTPQRWLAAERLAQAQALLETTDLPVDRIAERTGHGTATTLREQFQRQLGCSPSHYRATFNVTTPRAAPRAGGPASGPQPEVRPHAPAMPGASERRAR